MDPRLKEILDHYDEIKIGVDEPFKFHCTQCGKCCIEREDILLNPLDLYKLATELNMSPADVVAQYCEAYIGGDSRIPIVRIKPRGSIKRCPLLKDRKCSVHRSKPIVCAMFPIGRCFKVEKASIEGAEAGSPTIEYIFNKPDCGDDSQTHTVREWLGYFGIELDDKFFFKWHSTIMEISGCVRKLEKVISPATLDTFWTAIYTCLYINYDMSLPFLPQFEENMAKLLELIKSLQFNEEG